MTYQQLKVVSFFLTIFGALVTVVFASISIAFRDPMSSGSATTGVGITFLFIGLLGSNVAEALKSQAQRIERLEQLLAQRSSNPTTVEANAGPSSL